MIKRIFAAMVAACLLSSPAFAQHTKAQLTTDIASCFPDNTTGAITPATVRSCMATLMNSWQQYASVDAQTGTSYTIALSDYGQLVTFNNSSSVAVTLPQANGSFSSFNFFAANIGSGTVTITPTVSTINGSTSLSLAKGQSVWVVADPSGQYQVFSNIPVAPSVRYASQYGQADWCANLSAAITDLGSNPGIIIVDTAAGPSACSAGGNIVIGANHAVHFLGGSTYLLNQTIIMGQGNELIGVGGGTGPSSSTLGGVALKWTGATSSAMVKFFDASHSKLSNIALDCNSVATCTGIWFDSDNNPATSENILDNFTIKGFHYGILVGLTGNSAVSGASCSGTPTQTGCSENDFLTVNNFQMYGNSSDTTAEGIHVNDLNGLQGSRIGGGNLQQVNIGVHIINMNDNLTLERMNMGNIVGSNATLFKIESAVVNGPDLINNESEAGSFAVVDHSTGPGGGVWQGNQWNQPVTVDGGAVITAVGNTVAASQCTISGTAKVRIIGETANCWIIGSGSPSIDIFPSAADPLPPKAGGTGASMTLAVGDLLTANGASSLTQLADIATGNVLLSGGVTTAPSYGKVTSSHVNATTGSGSFVFATGPTISAPTLSGATTYGTLQNTANSLAAITAEKNGGDVIAYRATSSNPRLTFGVGGTSQAPFFGANIVFSSGNTWNIDKAGSYWYAGNLAGASDAFYLCSGTGSAGADAGTSTNAGCGFSMSTGANPKILTQLILSGGTPTIGSGACGTGSNGSVSGTNQSGLVTIGAAATTTCTISFSATLAAAPGACVIFPANATAAATGTTVARVSSISTSSWVITGSALASANYYYLCI